MAALVLAGGALFAGPAQATLTAQISGDTVLLTGDGGPSSLAIADGLYEPPGDDYAIEIRIDNGENVVLNDACVETASTPVNRVFCGNHEINNVVFNLQGGNDRVEQYQYNNGFTVLGSLVVDFGPGQDESSGDWISLPTRFSGGDGNDNLAGGIGPVTVEGGAGNDRLFGGGGNETIRGGPGDDDINGQSGNDTIFGDEGNDSLVGSSDGDTITGGPGRDNVHGDISFASSNGNDTLHLVDGEVDSGACGLGADVVNADRGDVVSQEGDCEVVNRSGSGPPGPGGDGEVSLGKPGRVSARKRLVATRVSCPAAARGQCRGRASFKVTFTERGKKRKVSLGRASFDLEPGQSAKVSRKLSKKLYRRLKRARKRKVTVAATSTDSAGTVFKSSRTTALRLG